MKHLTTHNYFVPEKVLTMAKCMSFILAASVVISAVAAPAAWYKWRSKLNGTVVCAQVMQGEWEKLAGPFKDAQCERKGVPGEKSFPDWMLQRN